MSQIIRKYQPGGSAPSQPTQPSTPKTYGKFIRNGREETVTEDWLNQFDSWLSQQSDATQRNLSGMRNQIMRGETVNFDQFAGTLSGNTDFNQLNPRQQQRLKRDRSKFGMLFDAVTNSRVQQGAMAIQDMDTFKYVEPTPEPPKLTNVNFSNYIFDYNLGGEDGKTRIYSNNPENEGAFRRLAQLQDYFSLGEEGDKKYKISGLKNIDDVRHWFNEKPGEIENIKQRIIAGSATEEDWDVVRSLNWYEKDPNQVVTPQTQTSTNTTPQIPTTNPLEELHINEERFLESGLELDMVDGKWQLYMDPKHPNYNEVIHIDDDFIYEDSSPYFGGFLYKGKLYTKEEALNNPDLMNRSNVWRTGNIAGRYGAPNTGVISLRKQSPWRMYKPDEEHFAPFHDILTGLGRNPYFVYLNQGFAFPKDEEGKEAAWGIAYANPESGTDPLSGMPNALKYHVYDPTRQDGNYMQIFDSIKDLEAAGYYNLGKVNPDITIPLESYTDRWKKQRYSNVRNIRGKDKSETPVQYQIFRGEQDGRLYIKVGKNDQYLIEDYALYRKIIDGYTPNAREIEKLYPNKILASTYDEGERNWFGLGVKAVGEGGLRRSHSSWAVRPWDYSSGKRMEWAEYLMKLDRDRQNIMGPLMYQYGGAFRGFGQLNSENSGTATTVVQGPLRDTRTNSATWEDIKAGGDQLTGTDRLELGALIADLTALGVSFVPGANIGAGFVGVGASTAQFTADIKRDGLDWGDAGRYGLNLGLDALTFIPGLGAAAKAGKIARNIRRVGKTVLRALAAYGAINAIEPAKKIIAGEKFTLEDLRKVVGGLQGVTAIGRGVAHQRTDAKVRQGIAIEQANIRNADPNVGSKTFNKVLSDGTKLKMTLNAKEVGEFNKITTPEAANAYLLNKAKSSNIKVSDDQAKTLGQELDVIKDGVVKKIPILKKFGSQKVSTIVTDTPAEKILPLGWGVLPWRNTYFRQASTGMTGLLNKPKTIDIAAFDAYKQSLRPTQIAKNRALERLVVEQPQLFGDAFRQRDASGNFVNRFLNSGEEIPTYNPLTSWAYWRRGALPYTNQQRYSSRNRWAGSVRQEPVVEVKNIAEVTTPFTTTTTALKKPTVTQLSLFPNAPVQLKLFKIGGKVQKFQGGNRTMRLEDMPAISNWDDILKAFGQRTFTQADLDVLNKQHLSRLGIGNQRIGSKVGAFQTDFNNPLFSTIIGHVAGTQGYGQTAKGVYDPNQLGDYNVDNRRGGVTESWITSSGAMQNYFANPNNTSNIIFDSNANQGRGGYNFANTNINANIDTRGITTLPEVTITAEVPSNTLRPLSIPPLAPKLELSGLQPVKPVEAVQQPQQQTRAGQAISKIGNIFKSNPNRQGVDYNDKTIKLPNIGIDPDNVMALGGLAMALGYNNRQANVTKKALRTAMNATEMSPFEVYPRFTDYGVNSAYENAAQNQLGVKPATSDYLLSHAIEQDSKNKADQLRLEGRLKTSELFSNYLGQTDELRRNYGMMRTDVANRNRQRLAQLNMGIAETEVGRLSNQLASLNNFLMEKRERFALDKEKFDRYNDMIMQNDLRRQSLNKQDEIHANIQKLYDAEGEGSDAWNEFGKYGAVNWYKASNPQGWRRYQDEMATFDMGKFTQGVNQSGILEYHQLGQKRPNTFRTTNNLFNMFQFAKKGGKISKKTSDSLNAAEHIWINQNKSIAEAVKQLHKNVIELFLKATS